MTPPVSGTGGRDRGGIDGGGVKGADDGVLTGGIDHWVGTGQLDAGSGDRLVGDELVASVVSLTVVTPVLDRNPVASAVRTPPRTLNGRSVETVVGESVIPLSPEAVWASLTSRSVSVTVLVLNGRGRYDFHVLSLERNCKPSSVAL